MFTKAELMLIAQAVVMSEKSCKRLASKEGQPVSVAAEYLKAQAALIQLQKKVVLAIDAAKS